MHRVFRWNRAAWKRGRRGCCVVVVAGEPGCCARARWGGEPRDRDLFISLGERAEFALAFFPPASPPRSSLPPLSLSLVLPRGSTCSRTISSYVSLFLRDFLPPHHLTITRENFSPNSHAHTHTHTHVHRYTQADSELLWRMQEICINAHLINHFLSCPERI